jgi:hypothetical protein
MVTAPLAGVLSRTLGGLLLRGLGSLVVGSGLNSLVGGDPRGDFFGGKIGIFRPRRGRIWRGRKEIISSFKKKSKGSEFSWQVVYLF